MNMAEGDTILLRHLPPGLADSKTINSRLESLAERIKHAESAIIQETLIECGGNKSEAARRLGISYMTLWRKLKGSRSSA